MAGTSSLFVMLNKVELIDVDTIEACGIDSDCIIKRTKDPLPEMVETAVGSSVGTISSLDGSTQIYLTSELSFARKLSSGDKDALKQPYAFIRGDFMYFPNITWQYVRIEAVFEDPDEVENLNSCDDTNIVCTPAYERTFPMPNYLEKPLKQLLNESLLRYYHQIRDDLTVNKNPS